MKKKVMSVAVVLLISVVLLTFVGCMKLGMTEHNVIERLEDNGYLVSKNKSIIEYSDSSMKGILIDSSIYATKVDESTATTYFVYVYYCSDDDSASNLESILKSKVDAEYNVEGATLNYIVYQYERTIVVGDFESVTVARNY